MLERLSGDGGAGSPEGVERDREQDTGAELEPLSG
jgi:hypothetical protein